MTGLDAGALDAGVAAISAVVDAGVAAVSSIASGAPAAAPVAASAFPEWLKIALTAGAGAGAIVTGVVTLLGWRFQTNLERFVFSMHGSLGLALAPILASRKRMQVDANDLKEPFLYSLYEPWMQPIVDFTAWLVRAGLAVPLQHNEKDLNGYTCAYRLTDAGARLLAAGDDHPVLPGFLDRLAMRFPDLPDEFVAHMVDALECLDHGLGRPAVSLLGLAYEAAEDAAVEHLESHAGLPSQKRAKAAAKIEAVRKLIPKLFSGDPEKEGRAIAAWAFADRLRDRRNQASHPKNYPDFSDLAEVHDFIVSAGRNLPGLWSVRV